MKALVTGASGFIGSTLIEELNTLGMDVFALMRKSSSPANLEHARFQRVEGDLRDPNSLREAVRGMDYVFHLAGMVSARNREEFFENNAAGTRRLAEAVAQQVRNDGRAISRFVLVSSLAAGGPADSREPRTEEQEDHPVSAYGESKLHAERELLKFRELYPVAIIRPPIVYGPRDKGVFTMIQTVAKNVIPLPGAASPDGQKYYSHIHVRDLVRGIIQAGMAPLEKVPSGEIFYLSGDDVVTYRELMLTIAEKLGKNPIQFRVPRLALRLAAASLSALGRVTNKTFPLNLDKLNEVLPDYWICSNQKAKSKLGFAPEFDLSTGMANAIEWYKENRWI
jgi:nucleoside-diphosphate-sugar epimerase